MKVDEVGYKSINFVMVKVGEEVGEVGDEGG